MKLQNLIHMLIGIVCIGLLPGAKAVVPAPGGGYPEGFATILHVSATGVRGASIRQERAPSSADQFRAFVQRHEEIEKQRALDEALASYAPQVQYYDHGRVSRDFVRKDKQNYFARWPSEDGSITGPIRVEARQGGWTAKYRISFYVQNSSGEGIRGEADVEIGANEHGGRYLIDVERGKLVKREKVYTAGVVSTQNLNSVPPPSLTTTSSPGPSGSPPTYSQSVITPAADLAVSPPVLQKPESEMSLEELLAPKPAEGPAVGAASERLWEELLSMLEQSDFDRANRVAVELRQTTGVIEPYQHLFAGLLIDMIGRRQNAPTPTQQEVELREYIHKQELVIAQLRSVGEREARRRPAVAKNLADARTGAQVAGAFLQLAGQLAQSGVQQSESELAQIDANIQTAEREIQKAQNNILQAQERLNETHEQEATSLAQRDNSLRVRTASMLEQLRDASNYRAAVALASCYLRVVGDDRGIADLAQNSVDLQRQQAKAITVAKAALRPVTEMLTSNRIWQAKAELGRALNVVNDQMTDKFQREVFDKEIAAVRRDIDGKISEVRAKRDAILQKGKSDPSTAETELKAFFEVHPDYPNADADRVELETVRNNLVSERLRQQIDAVEAALQNDTSEARSMLVRLEKNVGPDELAIVRSEIAHLENAIVGRELDSIEARTSEAQSYLTRYSVTYAEDLRHGKRPKVELTSGLVNLVRARSIQAGIVRQLEMLADTPMSTVSRARLTGSLETERTALRLMDESLFQRQVMIWTFAGLLLALATFGVICVKNQRSRSWLEKKWRQVVPLSAPGQNLPTTPAA